MAPAWGEHHLELWGEGRISFTKLGGIAYFFGDCFLGGWDLTLVSALGVLLVGLGEAVPNNGLRLVCMFTSDR